MTATHGSSPIHIFQMCRGNEININFPKLDAKQRKLIWSDTKRFYIKQSVLRIKKEYPNLPPGDKIEDYLLNRIDSDCAPEGYSEAQLDELGKLID